MDESDDDFKELCASFFQRVKKQGAKEATKRKTQQASNNAQISNKARKTKQSSTTKRKTLQGPVEKKPRSGSQAPRTKKQRAAKSKENEAALPANGEERAVAAGSAPAAASALAQPKLQEGAQHIQTENAPSGDSQPSPSKPRAAELVLQRMQQFKRANPKRLRRASERCSPDAAQEEGIPESPGKETVAGNGYGPMLPSVDNDAAVALALQQEFRREGASSHDNNLEEKGLFFCQICHKDLSAMNVTRREQHVNRCLDEAEKASSPPTPQVPECPICGRPFLTSKSRTSHLKQCAARMEVGPQLLLQAVRLQTATPRAGSPLATSFSTHVGGWKRKGATSQKEPQKRQRVSRHETPSEDMLVAMALSRSEVEQGPAGPTLRLESAFSEKMGQGPEKKSRRKKPPGPPPQLLVQDAETTGRQIEDRVAQLLSEDVELSSTPTLPASKILGEHLGEVGWRLQLPEGKQNFLWEASALTRTWAVESFYSSSLVPPIVPWKPPKGLSQEPKLPCVQPERPEPGIQKLPVLHSVPAIGHSPRDPLLTVSQREQQALQDLVELAAEGQRAGRGPCSEDLVSYGGATGLDLVPSSLPATGFVLPPEEKPLEKDVHTLERTSLSLGLLVADLGTMVNNPHLSDIQFQTDSGDVTYAHKFVLYARCPLLIQYINNEGFSAVEDGDATQRVLLSDVSTEATHAFLRYLYTADAGLPPCLLPDLSALARRFGVNDLAHLCEQMPAGMGVEGESREEKEDTSCESRAGNFQELLRSVWAGEEEEAETLVSPKGQEEDREKVNEAEIEEIYEFVATQRRLLQGEGSSDTDEDSDQPEKDSPSAGPPLASVHRSEHSDNAKQLESWGPGKDEATTCQESTRPSLLLPLAGHSGQAKGAESPEQSPVEAPGRPSPSSLARDSQAGREGALWLPVEVPSDEQVLSSIQPEDSELSHITNDHKEQSGTARDEGSKVPCVLTAQQETPAHPSHYLGGRSPSQSWLHLPHTSDSSLSTPQSHSGTSSLSSPSSPSPPVLPKQRRDCGNLTLPKEPGHQSGKGCSTMLECKNQGVLVSPTHSPPIDLTQSKLDPLSSRIQGPPSLRSGENEVILLLDSDEELELAQSKTQAVPNCPSEKKNVPEDNCKSPELFSVIDVDTDLEHPQSPSGRDTKLQRKDREGQLENQGPPRTPWLFCDHDSSPDEASTTDASWLVPATPLAGRSRDCSSQTQITSLRTRSLGDKTVWAASRTTSEASTGQEAAHKFSVIVPQIPPGSPATSHSGRQIHSSPSRPYPSHHKLPSPPVLCPLAGGLPNPTRPGLLSPAAASEVVEVGDSEDEQEAASPKGSSRHLLDSEPSILLDSHSWHAEPLSPIPIDHLNLERTGPLITSSPNRQASEPVDGEDGYSSEPLGSTPIRGSGVPRKASPEQSRAGSPWGSRSSFLNPVLWDNWDGEAPTSPDTLIPSACQAQQSEGPETPKGANRKNTLPPKVPITPMPRYSIMETPVLKKELDRFGVRPLPRRQMVLKLKEIFQYTHQTLESSSEDEVQFSQVPQDAPCSLTLPTEADRSSGPGGHTQLKTVTSPRTQRSKRPQHQKKPPPSKSFPSRPPCSELLSGPNGDAQLPASQDSMAASVDGTDSSFSSQSSSSCEFGAALESAGEGEEEEVEEVSASQVASRAADAEEAVRRYVRSQPGLFRKVLTYQPLELAELQAELKREGIRVATGKLLDILDAHCVTFTTAAARKEKLKRKGRRRRGGKRGEQE
ncbi:structure-specific endonuclease subunit SLX4 [Ctenodactylus gundi]